MVFYNIPQTLVRTGRFDGSLEDAVKKFREPLEKIPFGLGNTVKYAIFKPGERSYFLMVSQQIEKLLTPSGYNTILTVTSRWNERNKEITGQFEADTALCLSMQVPRELQERFDMMGVFLEAFEKNPKIAMDILRASYRR